MIIKNLSTLKIHKLTKEQYERELAAGNIDESAFYLVPDEENSDNLQVDDTLTISGAAADAATVGEKLNNLQHVHAIDQDRGVIVLKTGPFIAAEEVGF